MHPIFCITSSDIKALDDVQARELVARLCKAEVNIRGIGTDVVTWGGDQRAKDGGIDIRVEILQDELVSGYIPKNSTGYQVKAEPFAKAKIPSEMAPKGILRPAISDLADRSGAYIIVSTRDDLTDLSLSERQQAMAECLEKHGLAGRVWLDFYDSRKIADWVENTPAIVAWVKNELGRPITGWRPYGPWAYHEKTIEEEYLLDDMIKIRISNSDTGIKAIDAINNLRGDLSKNCSSVRLVGLSGVGKTRLVQALFDDRIATANVPLNRNNVLYTDLSDNPEPQPAVMLDALILEGTESTVIVDNCGQDVHQKLTQIVKRANSKIRLVTVEFDIRDNLPEKTICYHLEGSSFEVIAKLLKRQFSSFSDLDIEKIVEFSDGNARVAFALASTAEDSGELAQLRDDELFKRLFDQKNAENQELQRCAEAASLVYSFDAEDQSDDSELAILSGVAEVTMQTFYRNIYELQKRGLVQARGKWRAVLPHAISNRLALHATQSNHPEFLIQKYVTNAPDRVARSFSRRLGYLHESKHVQEIVGHWLKQDGLLGDVSQLQDFKWEMFENISPVDQHAALNAMLLAIERPDFIAVSSPTRIQATRLLRSLAYEPDMFDTATTALLKFALKEPDGYKSDSTSDIIRSLFSPAFSGTLASPEQRYIFVRKLAYSEDARQSKLALLLLRAGLESSQFPHTFGFDFGALKRCYGWHPRTQIEIQNWYNLFIQLAVDLFKTSISSGAEARAVLGEAFRGLWSDAGMEEALIGATRELAAIDGWPEGWTAIRNTIHFDKERLGSESLGRLMGLEKEISPQDLRAKIQAKVLSKVSFGVDFDDFHADSDIDFYARVHEEAKALGKAAVNDENMLADLEPLLFGCNNIKVYGFGVGIGLASGSTRGIFMRFRSLIEQSPAEEFDLQFICGLLDGWNQSMPEDVSAFLDEVLTDDILGPLFPSLQLTIELEQRGYLRLIKSIELGKAPCRKYTNLGRARMTDALTVAQISVLLSRLAAKADGGILAATDVLYMLIHRTKTRDEHYKTALRDYCLLFIGELDWNLIDLTNENFQNYLVKVIEFALDSSEPGEAVTKTISRLAHHELSYRKTCPRRLGNVLLPFFKKCPIETLDAMYSKEEHSTLMRMLTVRLNRHGETAINAVLEKPLLEWCKISPGDRCMFAARTCKLFERPNSGEIVDESITGISSIAINLLAMAPDKKLFLEVLVGRFYPNVWSGSLVAILRQRFQYLDQFNPTEDAGIMPLIDEIKAHLSKIIESEEQRERKIEKSETTSFE